MRSAFSRKSTQYFAELYFPLYSAYFGISRLLSAHYLSSTFDQPQIFQPGLLCAKNATAKGKVPKKRQYFIYLPQQICVS